MSIVKDGNKYINVATKKEIKNEETLEYIKSLRIPPAYKNVVIHPQNSKVLAYGYDSKGRKQVIYNKKFIEEKKKERFDKIIKLNSIFAKIQKNIRRNIKTHKDIKRSLICLILQIMILCNFRIGCEKYMRENKSYGLTTLEWKHIEFLKNGKIRIKFIGKKGVENEAILRDKLCIRFLNKLHQEYRNSSDNRVFKFADDKDILHHIQASDVNAYLQKFHPDITCKDIRTAMANYLYIKYFNENSHIENPKKRQVESIKQVAEQLHNTPAVCKSSYINPDILEIKY